MDSNKEIGNRIKQIRLSKGLTMEEFGKLFKPKANKSLVSKWESGKSLPNNDRLKRITEIGEISMNYLLKGTYMAGDIKMMSEEERKTFLDGINEQLKHSYSNIQDKTKKILNNIDYTSYNNNELLLIENLVRFINEYKNINGHIAFLELRVLLLKFLEMIEISKDEKISNNVKKDQIKETADDLNKYFDENKIADSVYNDIIDNLD